MADVVASHRGVCVAPSQSSLTRGWTWCRPTTVDHHLSCHHHHRHHHLTWPSAAQLPSGCMTDNRPLNVETRHCHCHCRHRPLATELSDCHVNLQTPTPTNWSTSAQVIAKLKVTYFFLGHGVVKVFSTNQLHDSPPNVATDLLMYLLQLLQSHHLFI